MAVHGMYYVPCQRRADVLSGNSGTVFVQNLYGSEKTPGLSDQRGIMVGGLVRLAFDKMNRKEEEKKNIVNDGILFCSGMIAGEGLVGILLALLAVFGVDKMIDLSGMINVSPVVSNIGSLVVFGLVILSLLKFSIWKKRK